MNDLINLEVGGFFLPSKLRVSSEISSSLIEIYKLFGWFIPLCEENEDGIGISIEYNWVLRSLNKDLIF